MTTAITTIEQTGAKGGVNRLAQRLGAALATLGDRVAGWSARYYDGGIGDELAITPPSERLDAALRWHARQARIL